MSARFLLRFDDATPTMRWSVWDRVEDALDRHGVRPLVAVVPDNQDPDLRVEPAASDFWDRVRAWQAKGWSVGLHGHQHAFTTHDAGLVGLNPYSEFAGVPEATQREKLEAALAVFEHEAVRADAWVAPAHSFDRTTLRVLRALADERDAPGLRVVSDGFHARPATDTDGTVWVPQRLWDLEPRRRGTWTVCYHANGWDDGAVDAFEADLERFAHRMVRLEEAVAEAQNHRMGPGAAVASRYWHARLHARRIGARLLGRTR